MPTDQHPVRILLVGGPGHGRRYTFDDVPQVLTYITMGPFLSCLRPGPPPPTLRAEHSGWNYAPFRYGSGPEPDGSEERPFLYRFRRHAEQ